MQDLSFIEIANRLNKFIIPRFDLIIGIANGGIIPAALIAYKLGCEFKRIKINYRDEENQPRFENPKILQIINDKIDGKKILIVDDVSVSGKTLNEAIKLFYGNDIKTFVFKGKADFVLFPEITTCVNWPWKK